MKIVFRLFARLALVCSALLAFVTPSFAAGYFATPTGAGAQDASDWANASSQSQIQSLLDGLQPGDTLNLGSGIYTISALSISGAGTLENPKQLIGVDTGAGFPVFQGTFNVAVVSGDPFLVLPTEAHHWNIKNLAIRHHRFPVSLVQSGTTYERYTHLLFENIACDSLEDAFRIYNASNLTLKNCSAVRYTKKAYRISDYSRNITVDSCFADCTGGDPDFPARAIPNGFFCDDTAGAPIIHDITFVDCTAINNDYPQSSGSYWNGDGFSTERGTYNVTFLRCKAYDNIDGGFDNKAENVTYQDCVASGNKRGFRHWGAGAVINNCVSVNNTVLGGGGSAHGLWVSGNGGSVSVNFSTFHNATSSQIYVESGGAAVVSDSILSTDTGALFSTGPVTLNNSVTYRPGDGVDPAYVEPTAAWRGSPANSMDSLTYGTTKGYNSESASGGANVLPTLSINATPTTGNAPLSVNFTASATDADGAIASYFWTFGDGQTSIQQNASVTYGLPGTYTAICTVTDNRGGQSSEAIEISANAPTTPVAVRIESGGTSSYTDNGSTIWGADHSYGTGGGVADRGAIAIANTNDDRIYQTERWGVSNYALVVANGTYTVNLHFAETYAGVNGPGQRLFTVAANNTIPAGWSNIDVFAEAGGNNIALIKPGIVVVTDNILTLDFSASVDNPMISGIEILPVVGGDLPPTAPTGLSASNITTTSINLTWAAGSDDIAVAGYEIFANGISRGVFAGTSATINGLSQFTNYSVTIRTRDSAGNASEPSAPLHVRTEPDPSASFELFLDNTDSAGVTITGVWTPSTSSPGYYGSNYIHDADGGKGTKSVRFTPEIPVTGPVTVYLRWTSGTNRASNVPVDIIHSAGTSTVTVNQQQDNGVWISVGTYPFNAGMSGSVLIRNAGTNGFVMADAVRFVKADADTAAPTVPGGLAANSITSNAFTLTWAESTDDVGVTGYDVFLDGVLYASPTSASVNVTGRTAETTYSATVRAIDAAGNVSAQSAALEVTTTAAPPDEPGEGSIGINLTDTVNALAAGDIVGVVPAANWNNSTANNEVMNDITDSQGVATTADFVFSNTPALYKNSTAAHAPPLADDASMMRTQRGRSNVNNMSVTATQIPYAGYDVYIYWGGRASSESVPLTMTIAFQLWDGAAWVTNETKYIRDTNRVWSGIYSESTATAPADAVDGNDYVVFRNVTADRFKVLATAANRTGISGLQVVAHSESTEEPAPAPVITDVSPVGGTYGEFFQYAIAAGGNPASYGAIGLPAGLSLDSATGIVSGTPATTGVFNIELSAANASGTDTASLMLTIAPAAQAITFPNPGSKTFGDASFSLAATASSNLPVAYVIASGPAELDGDIVTLIGAGTVTITATQAGNAHFLPATSVEISFDAAQRPQTITFPHPGPRVFGDAPVTLSATASSGLPVAYVLTSGPATLSGNVVTLTGSGTVTITATQSGDANTLPAEPALISFEIAPAPAEVSLGSLWQLYDGQPKSITVSTTPANLPVAVTYNGSSTPPTYPGSYDVETLIDAPDYTGVASETLVIAAGTVVRHAPMLNGSVRGSVQVLSAESITLNSSASVSGDLLVLGTPSTRINGQPDFGGVIDGPGSAEPVGFVVTLNGPAALRHLVRHIDPVAFPVVDAPPAPTGTRDVALNTASQSASDFATLRNLTLNAGTHTIPPGTYGSFIANGASHFVLGVTNSSEPAVYNLQGLTLNGNSSVKIVGPVVLTLARGTNLNSEMGTAGAPELLLLRIATGGLTLNGGASLHGFVDAPNGTIIINGSATLTGGITSDRLVINGDAQLVTDEP